jgi:ABC-type transport system involved in multi-copper enzyme maturation permease subunit
VTVLPIVGRELRVAARGRAVFLSRTVAALVAMLITLWFFVTLGRLDRANVFMGQTIFTTLAALAFGYALIAGTRVTSDCISQEKRDGTLGLLFLTDLKGHDVVLGKLAATSLGAIYSLLAIFPVLAIPLLLGGVTVTQFWWMVLLLANTLMFSLAVGLWVSTLSHNERKAVTMTLVIILGITAGLPIIGYALYDWLDISVTRHNLAWALVPSPAYAFGELMSRNFGAMPNRLLHASLITTALMTLGCLVLAGLQLPHRWQDRPDSARREKWNRSLLRWTSGNESRRSTERTRLLAINPVLWLACRDRTAAAYLWAAIATTAIIWAWGAVKHSNDWLETFTLFATAFILHLLLKLWLAQQACRHFPEERRSGALELLLSTTLSVDEILRGHRRGLWRRYAGPLAVVLMVDCAFILTLLGQGADEEEIITLFVGMAALVADSFAIIWVGLWLGLNIPQANRAVGGVVGRLLVLPWVSFLALLMLMEGVSAWRWGVSDEILLLLWLGITLATDYAFGRWAHHKLRADFRAIATTRFDAPQLAWWRRFWPKPADTAPRVIRA